MEDPSPREEMSLVSLEDTGQEVCACNIWIISTLDLRLDSHV